MRAVDAADAEQMCYNLSQVARRAIKQQTAAQTSLTCMRGLVGDSTITSCVFPGMMAAFTALRQQQTSSNHVSS
jgi:hypothetical protein